MDQLANSSLIKSDRISIDGRVQTRAYRFPSRNIHPGPGNVDFFFHRPKLEKRCIQQVDQLANSIMIWSDRIFINGRVHTRAYRLWNTGNDECACLREESEGISSIVEYLWKLLPPDRCAFKKTGNLWKGSYLNYNRSRYNNIIIYILYSTYNYRSNLTKYLIKTVERKRQVRIGSSKNVHMQRVKTSTE